MVKMKKKTTTVSIST